MEDHWCYPCRNFTQNVNGACIRCQSTAIEERALSQTPPFTLSTVNTVHELDETLGTLAQRLQSVMQSFRALRS